MDPSKEAKLASELSPLEVRNKRDEACSTWRLVARSPRSGAAARRTDDVEAKAEQAVVLGERERGREKARLEGKDVLEVVDQAFAVEEVVGRGEEVPASVSAVSAPGLAADASNKRTS